MCDINDNR